ncbi:hypothetical protein OIDMADRAFT_62204 [Oidiodendron maius Zn]|uniref:Uncharacterized protein n=1 Tax=Oidiodendron maius (strain Zn) TaxID=913774 RepID=A0A0C3G9C3_OIDMZ|nr:hypothetical protein OIDMADRAFT_62204 [Oidiodendron maius Zn]
MSWPRTAKTFTFPAECVEPWAQVTVLDAAHGDCNVVDMCLVQRDNTGAYIKFLNESSYMRILIDTGPNSTVNLDNLVNVLKNYGQPMVQTNSGTPSFPQYWDEAFVHGFQLTHVDGDHCGNAVKLIESVGSDAGLRKSFNGTTVFYHAFPDMNPNMILKPSPLVNAFSDKLNKVAAEEMNPGIRWADALKEAGLRISYHFRAYQMPNPNSPPPQWEATPRFNEKISEDNQIQIDIQKGQCIDGQGNLWDGMYVACRITLECQRKVGPKRQATATLPIEIGSGDVQQSFHIGQAFRLGFSQNGSLFEFAKVELGFPTLTPTPPPLKAVRDFNQIRVALDELKTTAENTPFPIPMVSNPWYNFYSIQDSVTQWYNKPSQMHIVGPTQSIYNDLIGNSMVAFYKAKNADSSKISPKNHDIANRASIVSVFTRPSVVHQGKVFSMVFTGDAYDRDCNISGTVQAFTGQQQITYVDVMKACPAAPSPSSYPWHNDTNFSLFIMSRVPHHGSEATVDAEFFNLIRARIYIICGKQSKHGSPALGTLMAIAAGFRQDENTYVDNGTHYFMFFSDAETLGNVSGEKSNTAQLLASKVKPHILNDGKPIYNYACYRLKKAIGNTGSAGRILFGAVVNDSIPRVWFGEAVNDTDPDPAHEWVFMPPT